MKYLCLAYDDGAAPAPRPAPDDEDGAAAGTALHPVRAATTIRVRNGLLAISDGALTQPAAVLSGFCVIEARDLNDAIRLAAKLPRARLGCIEIRAVAEPAALVPDVDP